jgi:hypothetical protein
VVHSAISKRCASDNHFFRTGCEDAPGSRHSAYAAANPYAHRSFAAELAYKPGIATAAHCGIQIDYVNEGIVPKAMQQTENVLHSQA